MQVKWNAHVQLDMIAHSPSLQVLHVSTAVAPYSALALAAKSRDMVKRRDESRGARGDEISLIASDRANDRHLNEHQPS
jgi:hypothetical protein